MVNHQAAAMQAVVAVKGLKVVTAKCVTMAKDDLTADNSAADVENVAPAPLACSVGAGGSTVSVGLPGLSYTTIVIGA